MSVLLAPRASAFLPRSGFIWPAMLSGALIGALTVMAPKFAGAKTPGHTYCFYGTCHRVKSLAEMQDLVGTQTTLHTSFYDSCKNDPYNPCGLTSSGEEFHPDRPDNAASPIYPDGTRVLVWSPDTKEAAVLRINNAGPYWGNRTLDVSKATAELLGFKRRGVSKLEVRVLSAPDSEESSYRRNRIYQPVPGYIGKFESLESAFAGMTGILAFEAIASSVLAPAAGDALVAAREQEVAQAIEVARLESSRPAQKTLMAETSPPAPAEAVKTTPIIVAAAPPPASLLKATKPKPAPPVKVAALFPASGPKPASEPKPRLHRVADEPIETASITPAARNTPPLPKRKPAAPGAGEKKTFKSRFATVAVPEAAPVKLAAIKPPARKDLDPAPRRRPAAQPEPLMTATKRLALKVERLVASPAPRKARRLAVARAAPRHVAPRPRATNEVMVALYAPHHHPVAEALPPARRMVASAARRSSSGKARASTSKVEQVKVAKRPQETPARAASAGQGKPAKKLSGAPGSGASRMKVSMLGGDGRPVPESELLVPSRVTEPGERPGPLDMPLGGVRQGLPNPWPGGWTGRRRQPGGTPRRARRCRRPRVLAA